MEKLYQSSPGLSVPPEYVSQSLQWTLKSPKTNTLADGLIERTSTCQMKQNQKPCTKRKKVINRGKRSKTLSEVKPVKNVSKKLQSFLEISPFQKEFLPSYKLRNHAYEQQNPFGLKEESLLTKKIPESIESSRFVSHRERMSGDFDSRKNSQSIKFERRPRIFVKLKLS